MSLGLREIAVAALAAHADAASRGEGVEARALRAWGDSTAASAPDLAAAWESARAEPDEEDRRLVGLAAALDLSDAELAATVIAMAVETDALLGRVLAWLQAPTGGTRPTLGLLAAALRRLDPAAAVDTLATGIAVSAGLLALADGGGPLPERAVAVPLHLILASAGRSSRLSGAVVGLDGPAVPLSSSLLAHAARHAAGLGAGRALIVRSGDPSESRAFAAAICTALGRRPLYLDATPTGLVPWLILDDLVPVFVRRMGPSERGALPELKGWRGPVLVIAGPDGSVETSQGTSLSWTVPVPPPDERQQLWGRAIGAGPLADTLAFGHRHGVGRIAELGRIAGHIAALDGRSRVEQGDILAAAWQGDAGLGSLASPLQIAVHDDALVLTETLRGELELLLARCRCRESLADGLGLASRTRYASGVRALFVGPSGTGKTLAAGWLATRLGLPLYRVDLASVVSKYIGETEKNLAELLARAESSEVVLFFDEADTLFGKRTDVRHSTDRFANSQTNYLLQRIESYDGVVVLASNSRARFDPAFSRRLDVIVEFPPPGPEERRALWTAHLGETHALNARELNRLAAHCDLAGGHVRNAVLAAAVLARQAERALGWEDLMRGLALECRKLGIPLPAGLDGKAAR